MSELLYTFTYDPDIGIIIGLNVFGGFFPLLHFDNNVEFGKFMRVAVEFQKNCSSKDIPESFLKAFEEDDEQD